MQKFFSTFPSGSPGLGLLLLRALIVLRFFTADLNLPGWLLVVFAPVGICLLLGVLTPIAAVIIGLGALTSAIVFSNSVAVVMTILAVAEPGKLDLAQDQIVDLLRLRRRVGFDQPNDFGISTTQSVIASFRSITFGVAVLMIVVSSIGLLVGGIGVMNVMLVSVTDRTSEIGMRKAIGARNSDVRWQFLVESMTITGIGGLLGLFLGWVTTFVINQFVFSRMLWWAPLVGFMTSITIGLVFGLWPASRAASLDPIEAIRRD